MSNIDGFKKQIANITTRAHEMRSVLIDPIVDDGGKIIAAPRTRAAQLKSAVANSLYESAGEHAEMIVGAHSRSLRAYCERYDRMPSDEVLASAHQAIENALVVGRKGDGAPSGIGVFENADMSTTEGIMMRDRMVSLVLPVMLMSVTSQMVTLIPGQFNQSELFRVYRVAGSTFGDLAKGDRIDYGYNGRYAVMDQMAEAGTGDGTLKKFSLSTNAKFGATYPLKRKCVKILHDRNVVGADDGNGHVMGAFSLGGATVTLTGTVDYATGTVDAEFSAAPAAGIAVHIGYDVDIEKDSSLIPRIDHQMDIHHLTLPWTPASIDQRNGRGVRQGNKVESVALYYYCGKGTFDSYRKDLLQAKSNWINDLLMGNATTMANGDVTGMDELLDMLADNPEEAKRQRAERLAAAKAKKEEAHRLALVNKLQALASIQHSLDTSDARKEERRKTLQEQLATAERAAMRYEREFGEAAESEKEELSRKLASAKRRKSEVQNSLDTLDEKFAAERAKMENNKKMAAGLLRQAERDGRLPFKAELIDNPGNAVVSTKGDLFCVGDYLDFEKEGIWKVTATDSQNRTVKLLPLTVRSTEKRLEVHKLPKFTKVSYSESELALKKLLTQAWEYGEVRNSGIDKETFLAHRGELKISANSGAVYLYNGRWIARFDLYDDIPEGAAYAWPEPENEDFRKSVCTQFLARQRETPYSPVSLMKKLFGHDFAAIAAEYGRKGTDTEILEEINKAWEEMKLQAGAQDTSQEFGLCVSEYSLLPRLTAPAKKRFDNAQNIERIARDFIAGIRVSLSVKLAEEKAEAERVAQEKLKSDPRYKAVPAELMGQFKELGITVRANTQECYLPGFRGRRGATHEPFSRWFLQDSKAKMGPLFRMKDILKARYGASFTDRWDEFSGAWWHVASSVDLKELYQLLA